jgi:hypothetical protein
MDLEHENSKILKKYYCKICNFVSSNKNDYRRHESTRKHLENTKSNQNEPELLQKTQKHLCMVCQKMYQSKSGLWNHKKKCIEEPVSALSNEIILDGPSSIVENLNLSTLVVDLLKQNQELQKQLIELSKEKSVVMNNCTNNNNTHFNLQFFLNETCKDAISADQFVKDIQISFGDLENIGNQGYVQGFTDIIMKQLRMLDITKRPFHCTDVKRETIYIKDANAWNKDNEDKTKLKNVIEKVAHKSRSNVNNWQRGHPEVVVLDSNDYEMNHKILRHVWGDGETYKLQDKVVKNIAGAVHVDKTVV